MRNFFSFLLILFLFSFFISINAYAARVIPYQATPDQVLVLYNADWNEDAKGTLKGQDSKELAEYYARMHTDAVTGKRPYLLGLHCRHQFLERDLNHWLIKEESNDNANGIVYKGKGARPQGDLLRDSRKIEIKINERADLDSISVSIRSELTGDERAIQSIDVTGGNTGYRILKKGKGRTLILDASKSFSGSVTVFYRVSDKDGKVMRNLALPYYDILDFRFSEKGADGIADDKILEEDVLTPVRKFLEDPANALPNGVLLKDHILYIVVARGMPYSAKAVFGIERGSTSNRRDHGTLASLEQRLQTIYYDWSGSFRPPVVSMPVLKGPDSDKGVVNNVITTAMRRPQLGRRWNPYMHKNAYTYTRRKTPPAFSSIPPLRIHREVVPKALFAYGVTRIDGANVNEAKRIIDYSLYASKYLRPEMDCRVRSSLVKEGKKEITDLGSRMRKVEAEGLWGAEELEALGFITQIDKDNYKDHKGQGVPFMARPVGEAGMCEAGADADWRQSGFYPGGMHRHVESSNGLNYSRSSVWKQLGKGATVTAAGAPAYSGGPHITNATFWDNRILMRYLLRGRDLGGSLLNSIIYVNWSNSLIGDPLMHPDLAKTVIDKTPPELEGDLSVESYPEYRKVYLEVSGVLRHTSERPEVALLEVELVGAGGEKKKAITALYSSRPELRIEGLLPDAEYELKATLIDPYGNRTEVAERRIRTKTANFPF